MNDKFLYNTNLIDYLIRHKRVLHLLYWVLWVCFFGYIWGTYDNYYTKTFTIELIELPVKMIMVYCNLYVLMPFFLFKRRYAQFAGLSLLLLLIGGFMLRLISFHILEPMFWPERLVHGCFYLSALLGSVIAITTPMIIPSSAKLLKYWYKHQQEKQILERENLQAELKLLKSQINPHFLFNTLNSLYALSLKRSEKTSEVVMKLSELMHYMLYDANQPMVPLKRELEFIKNYMDMEKMRYEGRFDLNFDYCGDVNSCSIAPLILLPFVENCFKHGVNRELSGAWITLDMRVEGSDLILTLENSVPVQTPKQEGGLPKGIGLTNVKRRLDILYPDAYNIKTRKDEVSYWVQLTLSLHPDRVENKS